MEVEFDSACIILYYFIVPRKRSSPSKEEITNKSKISPVSKSSADVFKQISSKLSSALSPSSINKLLTLLWSQDIISKEVHDDLLNPAKDHSLKCTQLISAIHSTLIIYPEKLDELVKIFGSIDDPVLQKLSTQLK